MVVILSLAAGGVALFFYQYATTPTQTSETSTEIWIKPGQSFFKTLTQLQQAGLVRHPKRFRWLAYFKGVERRIRAGEYKICGSMSPGAILDTLVGGETILHKAAIPEGATVYMIGHILESAWLVSESTFLKTASDRGLIKSLGIEGDTLEGYLFPETYHFPKGVTAEQIIKKMVAQFRSVFTPELAERARVLGFSIHQVVTLASIVEK